MPLYCFVVKDYFVSNCDDRTAVALVNRPLDEYYRRCLFIGSSEKEMMCMFDVEHSDQSESSTIQNSTLVTYSIIKWIKKDFQKDSNVFKTVLRLCLTIFFQP